MSIVKKQLTGIEIYPGGISAVELTPDDKRSFKINKEVSISIDDRGSLPHVLDTLFGECGFSRRSSVAVSPPDGQFFFNQVRTSLTRLHQVRSILRSQVEGSVPIRFEDIIADVASGWRKEGDNTDSESLLSVAMDRKTLAGIKQSFTESGIALSRVLPAACALAELPLHHNHGANNSSFVFAHFDRKRSLLSFYKNAQPVLIRTLPPLDLDNAGEKEAGVFIREIQLGWRSLFGSVMPEKSRVVISAPPESRKAPFFEFLPGDLDSLSPRPFSRLKNEVSGDYLIPAALALSAESVKEPPNFLQVLKQEERSKSKPVFYIAATSILALLLLSSGVVRLFATLRHLEKKNAELDAAIEREVRHVLPDLEHIVFPAAQLEEELRSLSQKHEGLQAAVGKQNNPVAILSLFNSKIPEGFQLEIQRISADSGSLLVYGNAGSFSEAEDLKRILAEEEAFTDIDISLSSRRGTAQVGFELNISVRQ